MQNAFLQHFFDQTMTILDQETVLTQNGTRLVLGQKRLLGSRFRVTAMTNPVLTESDGKHIFDPKRRFSNRFSVTVMTNAVFFIK